MDTDIAFEERGLVPCAVPDWTRGEVLTAASSSGRALERTGATGELHLRRRSRGEVGHRGAASGSPQAGRALRLGRDGGALHALVARGAPACHTGERTCFPRGEPE